ncbi:Hsp20/alpha crystallin family protein [Patescibacteria group bacterium]|nr:Hsp20/alpha crystallin family protein [Patescibacteria group bacterium]
MDKKPKTEISDIEEFEQDDTKDASQKPHSKKFQVREEFLSEDEEAAFAEPAENQEEGELAVDVYQTDEELVIQATLAGVRPETMDVFYEDDLITISGVRMHPNEAEEKNYYYQECFWGPFSREIILPEEVDITKAEATMKDGIFTLRIPLAERQKAKKIQVKKEAV